MEIGKEIKRRERWRREKRKSLGRRQTASGRKREERDGERHWETFWEEHIQRRIEAHGAENQFDTSVDPYSRNVKYLSGRILSEEQAIRVMAVPLVLFCYRVDFSLFPRDPAKLYGNVSRRVSSPIAEALRFAVKKI